MAKKMTIRDIIEMKRSGEKITVLTAYDASLARMLDSAGIDMILVGDSLANVLLGYESTVPVTMEEMLHHARAVKRGVSRALLVGDMPFMSYQVSATEAIINGGRFLKEAGCDAVKIEGGEEVAETVRAMVKAGIPVMGHIGLTPQTASQLGGYRVQGKDRESAHKLMHAAGTLEEAGAFSLVLECVPVQLAQVITAAVGIPTVGIGAGASCDGQVLVTHDMLGIFDNPVPSFVKKYVDLAPQIKEAVASYQKEVREGSYPDAEHSFSMPQDAKQFLKEWE
jgi:3-methyl-2-oxobutanoate hydroxymethyltransferase